MISDKNQVIEDVDKKIFKMNRNCIIKDFLFKTPGPLYKKC